MLGRYHVGVLRSPRQVRNALAYVLLNARKHWRERTGTVPPVRLNEASSGAWFDGWSREPPGVQDSGLLEVAHPHTWLLRARWRRHGLLDTSQLAAHGTTP